VRAVLCIADQLLDVLAAADAKHIVHRDIKPANIFLTRQGQLKVLDFGVARLRGEAAGVLTTSTGMTLGTPAFMAPEQALGRVAEIDGQSDLWAVGATMFGLITGRVVHDAQSAQEQMVLAATKPPRSLAEVDAEVPKSVVAIVDKALAFAKSDRWANAATMRNAVRVAHAELFAAETTSDTLASMISQIRVAVPQATPATDPMAPTALAEAVSGPAISAQPNTTSLVGTTARVTAAPTSRAFRVVAVMVLVAIGIGVGVALTRRTSSVADVASGQAIATPPTASAPIAPTASIAPVASGASATAASPAPPSTAPSASASASDAATTRPLAPPAVPRPSAKPSATARDNFDHQ
jgi:serine/threonine-protein kinase